MPRSSSGVGTVHYGHEDEAEDGSYIATVWLVILFVPIFPLRSERILPLSMRETASQTLFRYQVIGRVPHSWRSILRTLLVGWGIVAWCVMLPAGKIIRQFGEDHVYWISAVWVLSPFGALALWQRLFRPKPKLHAVQVVPGGESKVFRQRDKVSGHHYPQG